MAFFLFYADAIHWLEGHLMPCLFKKIFHVSCPGCGFQRSCVELLKGDVVHSLQLYPAMAPMVLYFGFLLLDRKYQFKLSPTITRYGIISIFVVILTSYIIKINF